MQPGQDPAFLEELEERTRAGELVVSLPKKMIRRVVPNHFKKGLRISVALHGAVLLSGLFSYGLRVLWGEDSAARQRRLQLEMARSAIRVDVVDLPQLKLSEMVGIDPAEEVGSAPPPPPKSDPEPLHKETLAKKSPREEVEDKPKVSATAMIHPSAKSKEKDLKKPNQKALAKERLDALRDSLRAENRRKELVANYKGPQREGGRPLLPGNIQSQGNSISGDVAKAGDVYIGSFKSHLQRFWSVPEYMKVGSLRATVIVRLAPDGRVLKKELGRRSGNAEFDEGLLRAVDAADPFPVPPEELRRVIMEDGFECAFPK